MGEQALHKLNPDKCIRLLQRIRVKGLDGGQVVRL